MSVTLSTSRRTVSITKGLQEVALSTSPMTVTLTKGTASVSLTTSPSQVSLTKASKSVTVEATQSVVEISKAGEVAQMQNVGTGDGLVFRDKTGKTFNLRTLTGSGDVTITTNLDTVDINATAGVGADDGFEAVCDAADVVGDGVYISGARTVGGFVRVSQVDITDTAKMPAVGIIESKVSPTRCRVRTIGLVNGVGSFTAGAGLFFTSAGLSETIPDNSGDHVQRAGVAVDSDEVLLNIAPPIRRA